MSVWPDSLSHGVSLSGSEGDLVSVSIGVAPEDLEGLLDTLAGLDFPINPQIYHQAESRPVTLVEFPAYAPRVGEVRRALEATGLGTGSLHVTGMLDEIHSRRHMGTS